MTFSFLPFIIGVDLGLIGMAVIARYRLGKLRSKNSTATISQQYTSPFMQKPKATEKSTEPFVGYRVWNVKDGVLSSVTQITCAWPFRKPLERDEIMNAGIHAIKNGANVPQLFANYNAQVAGSVYLWGEVTEYTEGYLAQFAYPKELWMLENTDPLIIMQLEHNYGVPVVLRSELATRTAPSVMGQTFTAMTVPFGIGISSGITATQAMAQQQQMWMQQQNAYLGGLALQMGQTLANSLNPLTIRPGGTIPVDNT